VFQALPEMPGAGGQGHSTMSPHSKSSLRHPSGSLLPCLKILQCGHPCGSRCGEECGSCRVPVTKTLPCGHQFSTDCSMPVDKVRCTKKCQTELPCGHPCTGTCGSCSLVHTECGNLCKRILVCSHACRKPCIKECPPCEDRCTNFCVHSKCKKKCGQACAPCNEVFLFLLPLVYFWD